MSTATGAINRPAREAPEAPGPTQSPGGGPRPGEERFALRSSIPFLAFHLVPLLAFVTGVTWRAVIVAVAAYAIRLFGITAGYHRYFAHRAYRLPRWAQFLMALLGLTAVQKGPLWWAAHHRDHHRYADTPRDVHSPQRGVIWSHVGWIVSDGFGTTDMAAVRDFAKYPELRFLNRHDWIGPWAMGTACFLAAGWSGLVIGFFASTVLLWHATFCVNSLAHLMGRRPYPTADTSRNTLFVAVITGGEGWHNNHHRYPSSARQGFRWWQIDPVYYVLRGLALVGIVHDLRPVPRRIIDEGRRRARQRS